MFSKQTRRDGREYSDPLAKRRQRRMSMMMGTMQFIFFHIYLPGGPDALQYL